MPRHTSAIRPKTSRPREAGVIRAQEKQLAQRRRNAKAAKQAKKTDA